MNCLKNASQIRAQIEISLAHRIPSALSPIAWSARERLPCEDAALDCLLHGGMPVCGLTEFVGMEGSGRTTAAMAYLRAITKTGRVCAWIDAADTLDPESAAANGVDLRRLLWVRCGVPSNHAIPALEPLTESRPSPIGMPKQIRHPGGGSPHPRSEGRDMPQAISAMMQAHGGLYDKQLRRAKRAIGTPGAPNRPLSQRSSERKEQIPTDRLPPRRGDHMVSPHSFAPRCAEPQPKCIPFLPSRERLPVIPTSGLCGEARRASKPWQALDQALRATDILLQGGGFSIIVLDLGSIPAEYVLRIPLATWFRFRAAGERTGASLLLLTQQACTHSSAELIVRMGAGTLQSESKVMTGMRFRVQIERQRSPQHNKLVPIRKPPQSEHAASWHNKNAWAQSQ